MLLLLLSSSNVLPKLRELYAILTAHQSLPPMKFFSRFSSLLLPISFNRPPHSYTNPLIFDNLPVRHQYDQRGPSPQVTQPLDLPDEPQYGSRS
jgi:hypothetical protein